jgi:23S rRNA (adenine-N6)-dimethyltransferase
MPPLRPGRHELGQNFLTDVGVIDRITDLVHDTSGPLIEWGPGDGAITLALSRLGRPLHGIEIDPVRARSLDRRTGPHVCISEGDILRHAPPRNSTIVSNVPFNITTPVLRHLLAAPGWERAVLVIQWEVARKRAGIGGATQMTAQWWPWYHFRLDRRIASAAFQPRPSVDGGLLQIDRRRPSLLPAGQRRAYQQWVRTVFNGPGRGLVDILVRSGLPTAAAREVCRRAGSRTGGLPRDLTARDWIHAFRALNAQAPRAEPRPGRQ